VNNNLEYYLTVFFRKVSGFIWGNPEIRFLFKILLGILALVIVFWFFKSRFAG